MKIGSNLDIRCPWCRKVNKLGIWDLVTFKKCVTAQMKRDYQHMSDPKAYGKDTKSYYMCPKCNKWSKGSQLKFVNTDNPFLLGLGGESIFSYDSDTANNDN